MFALEGEVAQVRGGIVLADPTPFCAISLTRRNAQTPYYIR
jgi:hypothetical protein